MSVNIKQNGNLTPVASLFRSVVPIGFGDCYSTEEKQVGCWIDGKPLYQKSIINTGTDIVCNGTTWTSICSESWISDVDKIVWGCLTRQAYSTSGAALVTPCEFQKNISNNTIQINPFRNMTFKSGAYFTIQYTKTTDVAGSGLWTPSGSYAVHYSETEHVIGTWIDGKPLYEITIDGGALPNGTSKTITTPANIKRVIDFEGVAYNDADDRPLPFSANNNNEIRVDRAQGVLRIITFATWNGYSFYLTIRYTKTTD